MKGKIRLTTLLLAAMLCFQINSYAQSDKNSKVTIEMVYEDKDGKKQTETKEFTGEAADNFDMDAYEKSLADRGIKVLNLNVNQSSSKIKSDDIHEAHDIVIKNKGDKKKMKKSVVIMKTISADSEDNDELEQLLEGEDFDIEEKDGKIYINGKEMEGSQKRVRVIKSGDTEIEEEMEVEVKDGKVFLNGEEVDDADIEEGSHKVIIKKMDAVKGAQKQIKVMKSGEGGVDEDMKVEVKDGKIFINGEEVGDAEMEKGTQRIIVKEIEGGKDGEKNIWISDDGKTHKYNVAENSMIFISGDELTEEELKKHKEMVFMTGANTPQKPRLGVAIEDGKTVNGAAVIQVVPDSPAAKAGLQEGDVVTAINETKVYGADSMISTMNDFKARDEVKVTYDREGKSMTSTIKLEMLKSGMHEIIIKKQEDKQ